MNQLAPGQYCYCENDQRLESYTVSYLTAEAMANDSLPEWWRAIGACIDYTFNARKGLAPEHIERQRFIRAWTMGEAINLIENERGDNTRIVHHRIIEDNKEIRPCLNRPNRAILDLQAQLIKEFEQRNNV
jgi:hypothetical protein